MSVLLAPLLAQLVTIGLANRTEARYQTTEGYHYQAITRPNARLELSWPRYDLSLGYGANLTLAPLESKPRELGLYHTVSAATSYRFRKTTIGLGSTGSFGEVNFRAQALDNPNATGMTTPANGAPTTGSGAIDPSKPDPSKPTTNPATGPVTPGGQLQPYVDLGFVRYGTFITGLNVAHQVDRSLRLSALASYSLTGALEKSNRDKYPLQRATMVGVGAIYVFVLSARDSFNSNFTAQQAWSTVGKGNSVTSLLGTESWSHRFDLRTESVFGAGLSVTRVPFVQGYSAYSVFPTFSAAITHGSTLARGTLTFNSGVYSAPALDPFRATVDPRLGANGGVGWSRDRFGARVGGAVAVSVADKNNNAGAFGYKSANALAAYRLTDWLQADLSAALAEQAYQGTTTVPLSYAVSAGLTFGLAKPIAGTKR